MVKMTEEMFQYKVSCPESNSYTDVIFYVDATSEKHALAQVHSFWNNDKLELSAVCTGKLDPVPFQ